MSVKERRLVVITIVVLWCLAVVGSIYFVISAARYAYLDWKVDDIDKYGQETVWTANGKETHWQIDDDGSLAEVYARAKEKLDEFTSSNGVARFLSETGQYCAGRLIRGLVSLEALFVLGATAYVIVSEIREPSDKRRTCRRWYRRRCKA